MTDPRGVHESWLRVAARALLPLLLAAGTLTCASAAPVEASGERAGRLQPYIAALKTLIDARAAAALDRIDGVARQLLAARSYLRAGPDLTQRWSWDDAQVQAFAGSADQQALLREIATVRATFEHLYPGFTLEVDENIRSLDQQLDQWNQNESVAAAAANLETWIAASLAASGWPTASDDATARQLAAALLSYIPQPTPSLAAPGLSRHGQGRAIDFHVYSGDIEVAPTEVAQIRAVWDGPQNWSGRLQYAMRRSRAKFTGPLITPREPWHYEYTP